MADSPLFPLVPNVSEEFDPSALFALSDAPAETGAVLPEDETALPFQPGAVQVPGTLDDPERLPMLQVPGSELPAPVQVVAPPTPGTDPALAPATVPAQFPAPPVEAPVVDRAAEVRADSMAFRDLGRTQSDLVTQIGGLDARIASAPPDEQAALVAQRTELLGSLQVVKDEQTQARDRHDLGLAELQEGAQVAAADASLQAAETVAAEGERIAMKSKARTDELRRREDQARSEVEESRSRYQAVLRSGPKEQMVASTLADMISETMQASLDNRVPNFAAVTERSWRRNQSGFQAERDAAAADVELTGDAVADLAAQRRAVIAEEEIQRAAVLREVTNRAELEIQRATTPLEKAKAAGIYRGLQEQADQADAAAGQARIEAIERADQAALKRQLDEAKLAKLQAETGKIGADTAAAQAKADKLARRGGGRRRPSGVLPSSLRNAVANKALTEREAKAIFPKMVIDPTTGEPMTRKDGTFVIAQGGEKIATVMNEAGSLVESINSLTNDAIAMRGASGWEPTGTWAGTDAGRRMSSLSTELLMLNKDKYGLGVLAGDDKALLLQIQGGELTGMKDPRKQLDDMRQRTIEKYNTRLRTLAVGARPVTFAKTTAAPKRDIRNVRTALGQSPDFSTADMGDEDFEKRHPGGQVQIVLPASRRLANADELFDLRLKESGGDIEKASDKFTSEAGVILKRAKANEDELLKRLGDARPANYGDLQEESVRAMGALLAAGDQSGEVINAAKKRVDLARAAIANAASSKARALASAYSEQTQFTRGLKKKVEGELKKKAKANKIREERQRQVRGSQFEGDF